MKYRLRVDNPILSQIAVVSLLIAAFTGNSLAQDPGKPASTVTLRRGQILQMKLVKRLNSARAKAGDDVGLKVNEPLLADGETILPKGSTIHARIKNVKRAGKNCQYGSIDWELEPPILPDNGKIEIRFVEEVVARRRLLDQAERDAAKAVPENNSGGKAPSKKGASIGGVLKGIALVPWIAVSFPLQVASEGEASCPGGKGREESFWAGKAFFAEVTAEVQISVH